ncbi:phosphoserine phosphatase SerB [Methanobrevibacter filiformis]|uniref:phosphoserine phosphatase n=1 Tax=Methanobrevibacter filiformis TaxID=55758 RepID=A0A165ZEV4_9EURY|nr:phosphoserine phosphatase SerB [Methanobrevibacter filiformis]KZX10621.1 phosphoserine phosphatase [Methanobrevibacter filiformis]
MIKLVVFDLDNVIINGEAIDEIGKLVNVEDKIAEITDQAMKGDMDFETSIKQRVQLLKGAPVEKIKELAENLTLMDGAEKTIKSLKDQDIQVAVISGSFDLVANPLKEKLGIDHVFTNTLIEENGKLTGEVTGPLVEGSKADVLLNFIKDQNINIEECLAIGDGANDISMLEAAEIGVAFNAKPAVKEIADVILEDKDLTGVLTIISNFEEESGSNIDATEAVNDAEVAKDEENEAVNDIVVEETETDVEDVETAKTDVVADDAENTDSDVVADDAKTDVDKDETADVEESEATEDNGAEESEDDAGADVDKDETADVEESEAIDSNVEESESSKDKDFKKQDRKQKRRNELPKTDFVASDDPKEVRQQKDEREQLITQIAAEREEFNKEAKEQRKIRDELNDSLKESLKLAIEFRDKRNKINESVEENKKLRDAVNDKLKKLEFSSGRRDKIKLENEIAKIDKIIETRVLDIKKENQLVKNANDLRKQLNEIQEDEKLKNEAQALKKESEEHHAKVVELSEDAQKFHENMLTYFRETDEIRTSADNAHKLFVKSRKAASAKHEEFKIVLSEIHVINKKLGNSRPKRRSSNNDRQFNAKKNREEKEKAEDIFDKFKKGKKLTTEELLLLQKHDIS